MIQKTTLIELLQDLEHEMLRLGYSTDYMRLYRRRWRMLLKFAQERGETFYSERLGMDFLEKYFQILEKDSNHTLSRSEDHELRVIRVIGDFQLHRTILHRYHKHNDLLIEPYFINKSNQFKLHCEHKGYSKTTIDEYVTLSEQFMVYLVSQNITDCKLINPTLIHNYLKTLAGYAYNTVAQHICSMRSFFRFLLEIEEVQIDFAAKIPMVQGRKQTRIPSVWTTDELKRLIAAIDRGNPKGKRDYAIILIACVLGLRCMDIKHLKMEDFHWEDKKLVFTQSKTKNRLSLPITPEVGWAVIDYLKFGRPKIDCPYIFVKHMAPFGPFSDDDSLYGLIKKYIVAAHLHTLKKRRGMHSLRHTMASMLLEKDTPLSTISDIMGHMDVDSTAVYLKIDIKKLKECALTFVEDADNE